MARALRALVPLLAVVVVIVVSSPARFDRSCATVLLARDGDLVIGHNLDESNRVPGLVIANPRGLRKESVVEEDFLSGRSRSTPRLTWVARFGSLTYNPFGREFPDGGLNEAGLYVGEMTWLGTEWPTTPGVTRLYQQQWIQYLLDNFETVEQALASLANATPAGHCRWHFFLADRRGDAAVIEFQKGKAVVYRGASLPIPVLCNDPYQPEVDELRRLYQGFGGDRDPLPHYEREDPRFRWAAVMLREDDGNVPVVDRMFSILARISFSANRWKVVYDVRRQRMYVRTIEAPRLRHVDMASFDFACSTMPLALDIHTDLEGDVRDRFTPLTDEANRHAVSAAWAEIDAGALGNTFWKPRMWRGIAAVPSTFTCERPEGPTPPDEAGPREGTQGAD